MLSELAVCYSGAVTLQRQILWGQNSWLYHISQVKAGPPTGGGGATGEFCPGPQPERGPLNTCLKDRYTLIEQSDLNTLIEQSQYSSEEQCSKLIDKEIWLVMGSYCHCQQVVTFFFFFFLVFNLQLG